MDRTLAAPISRVVLDSHKHVSITFVVEPTRTNTTPHFTHTLVIFVQNIHTVGFFGINEGEKRVGLLQDAILFKHY